MSKGPGQPNDPVREALENAPVDDLPESDEERRMIAEARANPEWVDGEAVSKLLASRAPKG